MIVRCLYDKLVPIDDLIPHPQNRNKHSTEQVERLSEILAYQGWRYPIKVSKQSGFITSGHGRLLAAQKNQWTECPVSFQDYDSSDQEYADVQADNAIASWATLDLSGINADIPDLGPDFNIDMLGIKDFMLDIADKDDLIEELPESKKKVMNAAWADWCKEQLTIIDKLKDIKIISQSLSPAALKIYFLKSLYQKYEFPRFATTARQYHRMQCSGDGDNGSILDLFEKITKKNSVADRLKFALGDRPSIEKLLSVSGIPMAGYKAPLDFPAELAKSLYNEFADGGHVLDPCHGWGGRYIGFLLSDAKYYLGVDASPLTNQGLKDIASDLKDYHSKTNDFICSPFEDADITQGFFDFALTSPPYFDREQYIGGDQAHTRYKTYDQFIEGFYTQLIFKTHGALKNKGYFALQIGNQKYDLDKKAIQIADKIGFRYVETRSTEMHGMTQEKHEDASEMILIFKKEKSNG